MRLMLVLVTLIALPALAPAGETAPAPPATEWQIVAKASPTPEQRALLPGWLVSLNASLCASAQTPARTIKLDLTVTPGRVDRVHVAKDGVWTFQGQVPQVGFDHGADEYKLDTCTPMLWNVLRATIDALSGRVAQRDILLTLHDAQEACQ